MSTIQVTEGRQAGEGVHLSFHSFYSATRRDKTQYDARAISMYSVYIHTCIYISHIYTYTHTHT